jgi:hypothetical protein
VQFEAGCYAWAKMKGFPWWPCVVFNDMQVGTRSPMSVQGCPRITLRPILVPPNYSHGDVFLKSTQSVLLCLIGGATGAEEEDGGRAEAQAQ